MLVSELIVDQLCSIRQQFELNLICAKDSASSSPEFVSYGDGKLVLSWETPSACERSLEGGDDSLPPASEERTGGGGGFFHVLATMFWLSVIGLILYFAIGELSPRVQLLNLTLPCR